MIVGIKFILALPIFFFASLLAGRSETAKKFQAKATFWMNVNLALALVMVLIGGLLKFVPRDYKPAPATASVSAASTLEESTQPKPSLERSDEISLRSWGERLAGPSCTNFIGRLEACPAYERPCPCPGSAPRSEGYFG